MELKFDSGILFDPKLIPKPKFKIGQTVFGVKAYYLKVDEFNIDEIDIEIKWVDNGYKSFYTIKIHYCSKNEFYNEDEIFEEKIVAEQQLEIHKEKQKKSTYNLQKSRLRDLKKHIKEVEDSISKYEQEQEQGT